MLDLARIESLLEPINGTIAFSVCLSHGELAALVAEVKRLQNPLPHATLTKRQAEVLEFISNYSDEHGYAPSFEEIQAGFNLASSATVFEHVSNLERKGWISRGYKKSRGITVLHRPVRREGQP